MVITEDTRIWLMEIMRGKGKLKEFIKIKRKMKNRFMVYVFWLIIGILLLIVEIFYTKFLAFSIGIAGLITALIAYQGTGIVFQSVIFVVLSYILFILFKKKSYLFITKPDKTNETEK